MGFFLLLQFLYNIKEKYLGTVRIWDYSSG